MISNIKGNKKLLITGLALVLVLVCISTTIFALPIIKENNKNKEMQETVENLTINWGKAMSNDVSILSSSNPTVYLNSPEFKKIKDLGPEYLPYIIKEIENGNQILAWAMGDITKAKINEQWETSGQWLSLWNKHLEILPDKFNEIKESIKNDKSESNLNKQKVELMNLGLPALPYILDSIDTDIEDDSIEKVMKEATKELLSDKEVKLPEESNIDDWKSITPDLKDKYSKLKEMVEK